MKDQGWQHYRHCVWVLQPDLVLDDKRFAVPSLAYRSLASFSVRIDQFHPPSLLFLLLTSHKMLPILGHVTYSSHCV